MREPMTTIRWMLLGLLVLELIGTGVELLLMSHFEGSLADRTADAHRDGPGDLLALPHMTPAIVKGIMEKRPFMSITDLNTFLLTQSLTPATAERVLRKSVRSRHSEHRNA